MLLPSEHLCRSTGDMSNLIAEFEGACAAASVDPKAALQRGGVHRSLWKKWKEGKVSPTLKSFEAAQSGLRALATEKAS